jgi:CubicO group peptidase (beta-lactamase class C family)
VLTLSAALASLSARSENTVTPELDPAVAAKVDARVNQTLTKRKIPGMSVAVYDGTTVWAKGYGLADLENSLPVTPETMFRVASISKTITAVTALRLYDQGKLDLDSPIQKYVPSYPSKQWPVTARLLLGNLGGVRHYTPFEINSTKHFVDQVSPLMIFRDDPLEFEPGTRYLYSTYGFNLVGAAIQGASNESYLKVVKREVFDPAGMGSTRADDPLAIVPHRARGYFLSRDGVLQNSLFCDLTSRVPGGGFCSTSRDLALFAKALLEDKLLKPETRSMMWTSQSTKSGRITAYGLGWSVTRFRGQREVFHPGAQSQVSTMLYLRPERKVAVAVLSNLEGFIQLDFCRDLAEIVAPTQAATPTAAPVPAVSGL